MQVAGIELEVLRRTEPSGGPPILLLHGVDAIRPNAAFLDGLATLGEVIAPSSPGFGNSPRPDEFDMIYDLVHLHLSVLDAVPAERVRMIGFSFGGWIAAEVAACGHKKLDRLVLVDPFGIKLSGREGRDFPHLFNTNPDELNRRSWHDAAKRPPGCYGIGWHSAIGNTMSDDDMVRLARGWDALCLYAWRPRMYNPQLKQWLHRIGVPALVLSGESDRIVTSDYGRAYAALIPDARFETIEAAGHHPELEQPAVFIDHVAGFFRR